MSTLAVVEYVKDGITINKLLSAEYIYDYLIENEYDEKHLEHFVHIVEYRKMFKNKQKEKILNWRKLKKKMQFKKNDR